METRSRSRSSSSRSTVKDKKKRASRSRSQENRSKKIDMATRSSSKSTKEDKNKAAPNLGIQENRRRKKSMEIRSSSKSTGKENNKGASKSVFQENRSRKRSVETRSCSGKDSNKGAPKSESQENTPCLTAVEGRSMEKKSKRTANVKKSRTSKSAVSRKGRSGKSFKSADVKMNEPIETIDLGDNISEGSSKSSHQEITPCLVVVEKMNMETRSKKRASKTVDVKMDEAIESLEYGNDRCKGASKSSDVEMNENVDFRKDRSGKAFRSTDVQTENVELEDSSESDNELKDPEMMKILQEQKASRSTNVQTENVALEDSSVIDSELEDPEMTKKLQELMKNIELGKITYDKACEMIERKNVKLEEFYESQLKTNKELKEEEKQLHELLNLTSSQTELIANTDYIGEQQDEVSKQSALLDILNEKICYHIRSFLDDKPSDSSSSSRNKQSKNSMSGILHSLIPGLKSGTISTEEIILKTDPSKREEIDFLLSANIIEQVPDDPTYVRLCKEGFLDIH